MNRRLFLGAAFATAISGTTGFAQPNNNPGEKKIEPIDLPLDKPGVWTLHFRYKPPRIVTLDGFNKDGKPAKQLVWYMWYQVYNLPPEGRAAEPVTFLPEFELVTKDLNTTHLDEPQPLIFEQIRALEDTTVGKEYPNGILNLQTTISISKRPIPPSKPDAIPRLVSGLAIWTDMTDVAPKTNKFSVYISGLSNGLATEELRTGEKLIKRKTLQINFIRPTDDNKPVITDIRPDDTNGPAEQWIYRTTSVAKPIVPPMPKLPPN
jgi:hypothetical protein